MARQQGVNHASYQSLAGTIDPSTIALHSSKVAAMEAALDQEGGAYVPWPTGKTLAEAIAAETERKARAKQGRPAGSPGSTTPAKAPSTDGAGR